MAEITPVGTFLCMVAPFWWTWLELYQKRIQFILLQIHFQSEISAIFLAEDYETRRKFAIPVFILPKNHILWNPKVQGSVYQKLNKYSRD